MQLYSLSQSSPESHYYSCSCSHSARPQSQTQPSLIIHVPARCSAVPANTGRATVPATDALLHVSSLVSSIQETPLIEPIQAPPPIQTEFADVDGISELSGWLSPHQCNNWQFNLPEYLISETEGLHIQGITVQ